MGEDQTVIVADWRNHRIMEWKRGDLSGQVVAGGNGEGNRMNQLERPTDVVVDKETNSFIICDRGNERVTRWSRYNGTTSGEILIEYTFCRGLTMDKERNLYVTDEQRHDVRRYRMGERNGIVVADCWNHRVMRWTKGAKKGEIIVGENGDEQQPNQLSYPASLSFDCDGNLYVVENENHRVQRFSIEMI